MQTKKRALCAFDDKRFLLEDGIHTLAFGHKNITVRVDDLEVGPELNVITHVEAVENSIVSDHRRDPADVQPRPSKTAFRSDRGSKKLSSAKARLFANLGFEDENEEQENFEDENLNHMHDDTSSEESEEENTRDRHSNPYILSGCSVSPSHKTRKSQRGRKRTFTQSSRSTQCTTSNCTSRMISPPPPSTSPRTPPSTQCTTSYDTTHMLMPTPPPLFPTSPRTPPPLPNVFALPSIPRKRLFLDSDSDD